MLFHQRIVKTEQKRHNQFKQIKLGKITHILQTQWQAKNVHFLS